MAVDTGAPNLIAPHGGVLVNRIASAADGATLRARTASMARLRLNDRQLSDLEMIAIGGFSPLTGFMTEGDYLGVVRDMHLAGGLPWSIPVTLAAGTGGAAGLKEGQEIALCNGQDEIVGLMTLQQKFGYDKLTEARNVYRTEEEAHPGVAVVLQQGEVLLGGPVTALERRKAKTFAQYRLDPVETRAAFAARGWARIVGFQTRNPVHRAHEYIHTHFHDPIYIAEIARRVGFCTDHFGRVFRSSTGVTFTSYVARVRVEKAKELLTTTQRRVSDVAFACGFESIPHFNRAFKRQTNQTPQAYRAARAHGPRH